MISMKQCIKCGKVKSLTEFSKRSASEDGLQCYCKKCSNKVITKYNREVCGHLSMNENKECGVYLGIAVAERLCSHIFKDVVRMPNGNPGYDFICSKNMKVDVKSSCIILNNGKNSRWVFRINNNQISDYFLLLAFDNRTNLEPQHMWLIPAHVLNHLTCATISLSTISKWDKYKQPIGEAITCCNTMKGL